MISDFRCTFDNAIGISPEITNDLKLSFPDAYMRILWRKSHML